MSNKKIMLFFVFAFLWSWIIWTPFVLPYFGIYEMTETLEGLLMLAIMLGAFGPLVSALILTFKEGGKQGVKVYFKRVLNFKVNWKFYILAFFVSFGVTMLAHYVTIGFSIGDLPNNLFPDELDIPVYILVIPYTIMIMLVGGGQEEFGWRGFIQDPLQDKLGIIKASLLIGLLWGLWHGPLWLIEGEGHSYYSFLAFVLYTTSWSLTIGIIYNMSGKKMIIPWLMHTFSNVSVPFFPVLISDHVPQPGYWVWVIINILVATGFTILLHSRKITPIPS